MNDDQRQAVLDNARYLRAVRPVDPAEINEYVTGRPDPDAVRRVLRDHALDLGLRERADGAFVPVEPGAVDVALETVERLPEAHARRLEDLLVAEYGTGWPESDAGDRLRGRIRRLKEDYYRQNDVAYDRETALGYAVYHLPASYAATRYVLGAVPDLPRRARVLEVGAGVGGPALAAHDHWPDDALVRYDAVEPSAAAGVFEALLADARRGFETRVHRETAEAFAPEGEYDLVVFANVLNELDEPASVVRRYRDRLAPDGSMVAVAPADRNTAIGLRRVERAVADEQAVYAPTVRLWPDATPDDGGWTFQRRPDLAVPAFQRRLDDAAGATGEFVNADVQYAWSVLRPDGRRAIDVTPDPGSLARLADLGDHVTDRIDCVGVKLSPDLSTADGANPLFRLGDGSQQVDVYAVLARESGLNRALLSAAYGDLLGFENALVLWNDDEGAYNLVVDEEAVVDPLVRAPYS